MTHSRWPGGRLARVLAAALMLAGAISAFGLARALAARALLLTAPIMPRQRHRTETGKGAR